MKTEEYEASPVDPATLCVRQLVLQPTPYCNIDCRYCYLPTRSDRRRMSVETLEATCRFVFESPFVGDQIEIIWHAGEPLVLPIDYYETAFAIIREHIPTHCRACHVIQTNGLLINDAWCDFFKANEVRLGLSIDGPAWLHDQQRVTRFGKGTHDRVMNAVGILKRHRIPFSVIAVLTSESLTHPDEIHDFFENLGARSIGFNIEETEANHDSDTLRSEGVVDAYEAFMRRIETLQKPGSPRIRELDTIRNQLIHRFDDARSTEATPLDIVSVDFQGNVGTFSPELLGGVLDDYGVFHFGNVRTDKLAGVLDNPRFQRVASDIAQGVAMCRESCDHFTLCGGGAPANKWYENGSFASTETLHCVTKIKSNTAILLDRLEQAAS